ncbi:ABC transporter permease [Sphaerotilus sp.]|uniref:ABC transporter permease n=1 Tax=Sphaerotilus sp. TaxID=2093942 RepID=UPI00286E0A17|nr:ABC transporter permease [Sphaerotilus sp.]
MTSSTSLCAPQPIGRQWARRAARLSGLGLVALPLAVALVAALAEAARVSAWQALLEDPRTGPALVSSLVSGLGSTLAATALSLWLTTQLWDHPRWPSLQRRLPAMLAVPHAALAIGLALLWMPGGWIARLVAPLAGWDAPPDWVTMNDPQALALTLALVLKETPFLLWTIAALLAQPDVALRLRQQLALGRSLGYAPAQVWWRVVWPGWSGALVWPVTAVAAYGLTVVDMALVLGPGAPPTLAVLAWQWLLDADPLRNAQGAAAACVLAGVMVIGAAGWMALRRVTGPMLQARHVRGPALALALAPAPVLSAVAGRTENGMAGLWLAAGLALVVASVSGVWRFPALWPTVWTPAAWTQVGAATGTLWTTLRVALAASGLSVALVVLWLEATPPAWDRAATAVALVPVVVPGLLLMAGVYRIALALRLDGTLAGLVLVHFWMALPYVLVMLLPAWRRFDPRHAWVAQTLGRSWLAFAWQVKRPLLAAPLASALAVGFAVSVGQYLPTQFIGAGRLATVTTEAVTLSAGGQRATGAAFAVLQALLPLLGFALAGIVGRAQAVRP